MRVLIVDDSVVFRTQIAGALSKVPGIEVAGTAANGSIGLQRLVQESVDVVILDMEMPVLNGIETLREIKRLKYNVKVIMFSSQTQKGAEAALDSLREGADDVVAKPIGMGHSLESVASSIQSILIPKILQFSTDIGKHIPAGIQKTVSNVSIQVKKNILSLTPSMIVIGCSTGGPAALEKIFSVVKGPVSLPILIVQHMPPVFTEILARRIGELSGIPTGEAKSGDIVKPNQIYVAPGNFHMEVHREGSILKIQLNQKPQRNSVRPAVDYLFESASEIYGPQCLGVVLTGMGEDGLVGARAIRKNGGAILIQDKGSCVVFGMPGAIHNSNDYDSMENLSNISEHIKKLAQSKPKNA